MWIVYKKCTVICANDVRSENIKQAKWNECPCYRCTDQNMFCSHPIPFPLVILLPLPSSKTWPFMLCEATSSYYNFATCHGIPILMTSVEWFFGNLGKNWWFWFQLYTPYPDLNLPLFKYLNFKKYPGTYPCFGSRFNPKIGQLLIS
jgi:hypothetical protein